MVLPSRRPDAACSSALRTCSKPRTGGPWGLARVTSSRRECSFPTGSGFPLRNSSIPSAPFLKDGVHKLAAEPPNAEGEENVPKLLYARTPEDAEEVRKIHKLSRSRHAPGDWILRARIISLSWR